MQKNIIPQVKEIKSLEKTLELKNFYLSDELTAALPIADEIFSDNQKGAKQFPITFVQCEDECKEFYRISARCNKIEITSNNARGLMDALFTLSELALLNDDMLCEFDAYDHPSLSFRAYSDDISRGQVSTLSDFFAIIRKLARYKYNTYMPYIEDTFKFVKHPAWGRYSDPVGKAEWQAIIEYAKKYHIEVRPIINLLGHFDKLSNIKELQPLALRKLDGTPSHVMDPKNPQVREIIIDMLDEIVDTFGKGKIHCGGDEPVDLTHVYGKEEGGTLFIEHYTFIANELKKRGCVLMMYADFFAPPWGDYSIPIDRAKELPPETEFVFWDYGVRPEYPLVPSLHKQGVKLYISPGNWIWKRFTCDMHLCYGNTKGLLKADAGKSLGMIMSSWADGGDTLRELAWPGICIGANFCWSPASDYSYEEIYNIYHRSFFGFTPSQAALLEPVYHHDSLISRENEHEFKNEIWVDPFTPVTFKDKEHIGIIQAAMAKAKEDIKTLSPARNLDAFNALVLGIARISFTADKIAFMPHEMPTTIEDGIPYGEAAKRLATELLDIKALHRRLWFNNNRLSEWELCESRYDDLHDRLQMFARNVRLRKFYNIHI